jgi:glycosyltransferase involved in cell wall biosynthesis
MLVGRKKNDSLPLTERSYTTKRLSLAFNKGMAFYANLNFRLFFLLLFHRADILLSNDLDTLPANYLVAVIKRKKLVYDTHEYFTGVPELNERKTVKKIWKKLEAFLLPRVKNAYTVNDSIASLYEEEYGIHLQVIRNMPIRNAYTNTDINLRSLGVPAEKAIVVYQGAVNKDRGLEEAITAMQWVDTAVLLIIGTGDLLTKLREEVKQKKLQQKVFFTGLIPMEQLPSYTSLASLGLSIEKDTNLNYRYSLPNKVFDYIQAGIPLLAYPMKEVKSLIDQYGLGDFIHNHEPSHLAEKINQLLNDKKKLQQYADACKKAAELLSWDKEEKKLKSIFENIT